MLISLTTLLAALCSIFRSRAALELENLALRHQIGVLQRCARKRPKLTAGDRLLWVCLSRIWSDWRAALAIVKPRQSWPGIARAFVSSGPIVTNENSVQPSAHVIPQANQWVGSWQPTGHQNCCSPLSGKLILCMSQTGNLSFIAEPPQQIVPPGSSIVNVNPTAQKVTSDVPFGMPG